MDNGAIMIVLIFLVPGLLALVIGICNDLGRKHGEQDDARRDKPDNVFFTTVYLPPRKRHEKNYYINKRNHRHDEKIRRHKSMQ